MTATDIRIPHRLDCPWFRFPGNGTGPPSR